MKPIHISIHIARPANEVFAYLSNFENNPIWQSGMISATFTSEPPLRVGSTYDQVATFLGRDIITSFEVIEYEVDKKVKAHSVSGTFPITFTRQVEEAEEGSHVTALVEGKPNGFFRLLGPLLRPMVRKNIERDYQKLKQILEGSPTS